MGSHLSHLECAGCGEHHDASALVNRCSCGGTLLARYDPAGIEREEILDRPGGLWRYRELLPVMGDPVSLGEGETPLLPCPTLSKGLGVEVYVKDEGPLPGGTFKARGAAVGLSCAAERGAKAVVMPSAGNAGGAWSLYAARAGLQITVTMARTAPESNQTEVRLAGAELILVKGTIADAGRRASAIAGETGAFLTATFSEPYRLEGKKSAWFEIFDALGSLPRTIVMPVGGGVALMAAAKAVSEVSSLGWFSEAPPRLVGVQPEDCAPIVRAFERGADEVLPWPGEPATIAAGLRVPAPSEGDLVLKEVRASSGAMLAVSEAEITGAVRELASSEGIFACPEGAATLAAAAVLARRGEIEGPVVLYNTGSAAKYLDSLS